MKTSTLILLAILVHLAAFVCFPYTGKLGPTFTYISLVLWVALAIFLGSQPPYSPSGQFITAALFLGGCVLSTLSFLPQKDAVSPIYKLARGAYPSKADLYLGLLRVGVDAPALKPPPPPEQEEILP